MKEKIVIKVHNPCLNYFEILDIERKIVSKLNDFQCKKIYIISKNVDSFSKTKTIYIYFDIENSKNEQKINQHIKKTHKHPFAYYIDDAISSSEIQQILKIKSNPSFNLFSVFFKAKKSLSIEKLIKKPFNVDKTYLFGIMINLICIKINESRV